MPKPPSNQTRTPTTPAAAARVQSHEARTNGGAVAKGGQASRMQRAAAANTRKPGST